MSFPTTLDGLYINGQWSAGNEHLRVINPATEALLTTCLLYTSDAADE